MPIKQSLHEDSVEVQSTVTSADDVLHRLSELVVCNSLASGLRALDVYRGLKEREKIGSTGLGLGVAIPHFASDKIDEFVLALLTARSQIDFKSIDGKPADVFFCIVGPRTKRDQHIKLLSAISKFFSKPGSLEEMRGATDPGGLRELLLDGLSYDEESVSKERVLFQIFVQNLDCFEDVLNLLSSVVPGSISVIETRNAGAYLFRMPLFAAFWTDKSTQDGRMILAIVDRQLTNSLIRQIQEATGDPEKQTGVLVTVQDLTYAAGSLTF